MTHITFLSFVIPSFFCVILIKATVKNLRRNGKGEKIKQPERSWHVKRKKTWCSSRLACNSTNLQISVSSHQLGNMYPSSFREKGGIHMTCFCRDSDLYSNVVTPFLLPLGHRFQKIYVSLSDLQKLVPHNRYRLEHIKCANTNKKPWEPSHHKEKHKS